MAMEDIKFHNNKNIIDYLGSCFPSDSDNFFDIMITCSDGHISAHKLVLASISPMLYSEFKQNISDKTLSIVLPDYSLLEVTQYLKAIYSCQDISKFTIFNQMIGSIETEEIEIDKKDILDIENVNSDPFETDNLEVDREYIRVTETLNDPAFENEKISSLPAEVIEDKPKMINIVKKKKEKKWERKKLSIISKNFKIKQKFLLKNFTTSPDDLEEIYCNFCSKQYSSTALIKKTNDLLNHLYIHDIVINLNEQTRSWKCPSCPKVFISEDKMNKHIDYYHSEVVPCAYCGKIIKNRFARMRHEREHKAKLEGKFSCEICNKSFIDDSCLKRHIRIHTGEMPYQCSDCGKRFVQSSGLKQHQKHHTGETPYECKRCFRKFKFVQVYDKHKCIPQN